MSRRNLYNQVLKFFTFCAPVGFRHEDQPVDIVDIYHQYNNPDKKYIFTLRQNSTPAATTLHPRWNDSGDVNIFGRDRFGFNGVASGCRYNNGGFGAFGIGIEGFLWVSTDAGIIDTDGFARTYHTNLFYYNGTMRPTTVTEYKLKGFAIRAVRPATTAELLLSDGLISATYTDYDGNIYGCTKIGLQVWTTSNLKTTHYVDGTVIPTNLSDASWAADTIGAMAVCGKNDGAFVPVDELTTEALMVAAYGRLYNWYAVDNAHGLIDPTDGWHVPTDAEFTELTDYLIATYPEITIDNIGDVLKSTRSVNSPYTVVKSAVDKFSLTQGTTARHGYEIAGVKYVDDYNVFSTTIVGTLPAGDYTEIPVVSTAGAKDSGVIRIRDTASYSNERFRYFTYTSKTSTSFIGESQTIVETSGLVHQIVETKGINNYVIVNGNIYGIQSRTWNIAIVNDDQVGIDSQIAVAAGVAYEWLYCGKYVQELAIGSSSLGYGSVKYIHLENETQLEHINYCDFYGVSLTGELNIPKSIIALGTITGYVGWVGFNAGYLTKVTISENVTLIVDSFNNRNTLLRFDCYPLVAPTVVTDGNPFMLGHPVPLHIRPDATGYDISPWTDTTVFSHIIRDL